MASIFFLAPQFYRMLLIGVSPSTLEDVKYNKGYMDSHFIGSSPTAPLPRYLLCNVILTKGRSPSLILSRHLIATH